MLKHTNEAKQGESQPPLFSFRPATTTGVTDAWRVFTERAERWHMQHSRGSREAVISPRVTTPRQPPTVRLRHPFRRASQTKYAWCSNAVGLMLVLALGARTRTSSTINLAPNSSMMTTGFLVTTTTYILAPKRSYPVLRSNVYRLFGRREFMVTATSFA